VIEPIQHFWLALQHGQLPDIGGWNYMLMAFFVMVQGRSAAVFSGIAAATGTLDFGLVILVAVVARVGGDLIWYQLGATGAINRLAGRIAFFGRLVNRVQAGVNDRPQRVILLSKLTNGLATPAVLAAGSAGVPYRRWLPASFAGELIWILPLTAIGFFAIGGHAGVEEGVPLLMGGVTTMSLAFLLLKAGRARLKASRRPA
jgi:membrane protein DedA with SNARE-associated domain